MHDLTLYELTWYEGVSCIFVWGAHLRSASTNTTRANALKRTSCIAV
jgi:hypothetical protein